MSDTDLEKVQKIISTVLDVALKTSTVYETKSITIPIAKESVPEVVSYVRSIDWDCGYKIVNDKVWIHIWQNKGWK